MNQRVNRISSLAQAVLAQAVVAPWRHACGVAILSCVAGMAPVVANEDVAQEMVARILAEEVQWNVAFRLELQQAYKGGRLSVAELADVVTIAQAFSRQPAVTASTGAAPAAGGLALQGQPASVSGAPTSSVPAAAPTGAEPAANAEVDNETATKAAAVLQDILGQDALNSKPVKITALSRRDGQFMVIVDAGANRGMQVNQSVTVERDGKLLATGVVVKVVDANAGVLLSGDPNSLLEIRQGDQVFLGK